MLANLEFVGVEVVAPGGYIGYSCRASAQGLGKWVQEVR